MQRGFRISKADTLGYWAKSQLWIKLADVQLGPKVTKGLIVCYVLETGLSE